MKINNINNCNYTPFMANKMPKKEAQYIDKVLKNSKNIDIVCHETSDRDAVNSAIAVYDYLNQQGINSRIILSQNLNSLGLRKTDQNIIQANDLIPAKSSDTILCVDFSASDRIPKNVLEYIKKANKVLCFDHHHGMDLVDHDYIYLTAPVEENENVESVSSFYMDTSAKSTTSIIYRFFEALEKEINNDTAYDLFYGLIDDCVKRGLVNCDGGAQNAESAITPKRELLQDKNAYEIYENLKSRLSEEEIFNIAKKIDIMSSLTPVQEDFKNSLYKKVNFSENGKIAYVELSPNDETWESLGGDNTTTSTILNRFRQSILNSDDEKFKNVQTAMVFYEAKGNYRVSIHSKAPTLDKFYEYAENNISNSSSTLGGHKNRGGGKINSTDPNACHTWVKEIIKCSDFYD